MMKKCFLLSFATSVLIAVLPLHAGQFTLLFDNLDTPDSAKDSSGNDLNMEVSSGSADISTEMKKFGVGSLQLLEGRAPGIRQSLAVPPFDQLAGEMSRMSIVCWVYLPESGVSEEGFFIAGRTYDRQALKDASPEERAVGVWRFTVARSMGLWFEVGSGGKIRVDTSRAMPSESFLVPEQWIHLAMTFEQGVVNFYINGQQVHGGFLPGGVSSIPAMESGAEHGVWDIGSNPGYAYPAMPHDSHIDDFGFFGNRVLSAKEIDAIHQHGLREFLGK